MGVQLWGPRGQKKVTIYFRSPTQGLLQAGWGGHCSLGMKMERGASGPGNFDEVIEKKRRRDLNAIGSVRNSL